MTVAGIAGRLVDEGLHPINPDAFLAETSDRPKDRERHLESGLRVVRRLRSRLCKEGLIERGKPGRPRKRATAQ